VIFGIGTDIVHTKRIETILSRHGDRFASKVLSEQEMKEFRTHAAPSRMIAKRFAAKEAFAKAIGSGIREPVRLGRITVSHDDLGKPVLVFDKTLQSHLVKLGITTQHLSISDDHDMAVAFVVLETA